MPEEAGHAETTDLPCGKYMRSCSAVCAAMKTYTCKTLLRQFILLSCAPQVTPEPDADAGSGYLRQKYVGSYDIEALLSEPVVRISLKRLLGREMKYFSRNLYVRGSGPHFGQPVAVRQCRTRRWL